jgi:bifunctional UDP-N-acetylglucosamine pyrophosphorylase / glucosamine-1-phosphate N-acetyltransferase
MTHQSMQAILLAAGKSTRFKTDTTKLAYKICGQEIIVYPVKLLTSLRIPLTMVVGYQHETIRAIMAQHGCTDITFVEQKDPSGTGHALALTQPQWHADHILVMNGDMPLVDPQLIEELMYQHTNSQATISFVIAHNPDPTLQGYGRVVIKNHAVSIIEASDFIGDATHACCVNAGIYLIKRPFLESYIDALNTHNKANEFYLTDLIEIASKNQYKVTTVNAPFDSIRGINTLKELWGAEHIKRSELISNFMAEGIHFTTAHNVHIDLTISIGAGSRIESGVRLLGATHIGKNCIIEANSIVNQSVIGDNTIIKSNSVVHGAMVGTCATIGPFAHIREHSTIGNNSIIGNFVEINRSSIGTHTKIKHLSYIGDATVGSQVNIGAGTIICNYDGKNKHKTIIEDGAFIGSNNSLIAPLTIGQEAMTAAGSTITEDVPSQALAIARARQVNKEGYAQRKRSSDTCVKPIKSTTSVLENV